MQAGPDVKPNLVQAACCSLIFSCWEALSLCLLHFPQGCKYTCLCGRTYERKHVSLSAPCKLLMSDEPRCQKLSSKVLHHSARRLHGHLLMQAEARLQGNRGAVKIIMQGGHICCCHAPGMCTCQEHRHRHNGLHAGLCNMRNSVLCNKHAYTMRKGRFLHRVTREAATC